MDELNKVLGELEQDDAAKPVIEKLKPVIEKELGYWKSEAQSAFEKRDKVKQDREAIAKQLEEVQTNHTKALEEAINKHSQELKNLSEERDRFKTDADIYREHLLSQLPEGKLRDLGNKLTDLKDLRELVETLPKGGQISTQPPAATKAAPTFSSYQEWKKAVEA